MSSSGSIRMARGRVILFRITYYPRRGKQLRWCIWWSETGKRCCGDHVLHQWFRTEDAALAHVKCRWRAVRSGFKYPIKNRKAVTA